ncbi:TPA: MAPEG family protein [Pseudomonas aeruginosa]|nr:MAPEG family protein [Stenotrophomonas sp.]HEJ1321136.1 MAPEG family protein [Pseudomonas aeruginosa]
MTTPVWTLLVFAGWTLFILFSTVGVYRWSKILTGRATISGWQPEKTQGSAWYQRAMSAHRNCIENLPVYGAIVFVLSITGLSSPVLDGLAITVIAGRIAQSVTHICLEQTERIALFRFVFYFSQIIAMIWMGVYVTVNA